MITSAADLPARRAGALARWLLALADSKRLLGIRYGEWCTGAPELEADIACTAMAQYELGHARILYGLLPDFPQDPRGPERQRSAAGYRHLPNLDQPFGSWTDVVLANALVDTALTVALEVALESRYRPLALRLRKAVEEEEFHYLHGEAWFLRLAEEPESRARLSSGLEAALQPLLLWPGPDEGETALLASQGLITSGPGEQRAIFLERLRPLLEPAGFQLPAVELRWDGWDDALRRLGPVRLDGPTLELLRHAEAAEFASEGSG